MSGILDIIIDGVGIVLYMLLGRVFFGVINIVDNIFRALAGMGQNYSIDGLNKGEGATDVNGGLVYDLLQTDIIKKLIMSIMILASVLLIIFTVMAFLKNVYAQKQKTAKDIIASSLKGVLYFVFVPVCTLLGVYLGNIVLKAVDGATSLGGATTMSGKLFIASAYDANKFRTSTLTNSKENIDKLKSLATGFQYKNADRITEKLTQDECAFYLDDIFATSPYVDYGMSTVNDFYKLSEINFVLLIVGGVFILYVLCSLAFAMARRIFIMLIWFAISPACCAMFPLDDGKMVGKYKDEMTKQVLSAYGAVAAMNLFMSVMPLIDNIKITSLGNDANGFVNLFIMICGLLCVKELVSSLSSLVGGEDALAKGSSLMKQTTGAMKKTVGGFAKKTAGMAGNIAGNIKSYGAKGILHSFGDGAKGIGGFLTKSTLGIDVKDVKKTFKDTSKSTHSDNRESMQKKIKGGFLSGVDGKKEYTGAELADLIDKGADNFASADEIFEKASGGNMKRESELRKAYREHKATESKQSESRATYLAPLEKAKNEYDTAHQEVESANDKVYDATKEKNRRNGMILDSMRAADSAGSRVNGNRHTTDEERQQIRSAKLVIDQARAEFKNGNLEGAAAALNTIDPNSFNSDATKPFQASLLSLVGTINQAIAAQEALTVATTEQQKAKDAEAAAIANIQNVANSVAETLGGDVGEALKDTAKKLHSVNDVYDQTKIAMGAVKKKADESSK